MSGSLQAVIIVQKTDFRYRTTGKAYGEIRSCGLNDPEHFL